MYITVAAVVLTTPPVIGQGFPADVEWYVGEYPGVWTGYDADWNLTNGGQDILRGLVALDGDRVLYSDKDVCGTTLAGLTRWDLINSCASFTVAMGTFGAAPRVLNSGNSRAWYVFESGVVRVDSSGVVDRVDRFNPSTPIVLGFLAPGEYPLECNGRDLITKSMSGSPGLWDLHVRDLADPGFSRSFFATVPQVAFVALRNGNELILIEGGQLCGIDIYSGVKTVYIGMPQTWPATTNRPYLDYNPWSDAVAIDPNAGGVEIYAYEFDQPAQGWSLKVYRVFLTRTMNLFALYERPFEKFGSGCVNSTNKEPRMGWSGVPRQGTSFSVDVQNTEPNAFVAFWLGISDRFWTGVGNLPFDAGRLGAPGCTMYASAEDWLPALADANGDASVSFSVPVDPTLHGLEFFMQSASTSSSNALGMAASEALLVRVR